LLVAALSTGCGATHPRGSATPNTVTIPAIVTEPPPLTTSAREVVGRVRTELCDGVAFGSGFFIDPSTFITNHHVVEGALSVSIDTPQHRTYAVDSIEVASSADLARLRVRPSTAHVASVSQTPPASGDHVDVVGFPRGGKLTATEGRIIESSGDTEEARTTLRLSNDIEPGNSGSPVFNDANQVVGVASAIDLESGQSIVIPSSDITSASWHASPRSHCGGQ
jgi:S1-C subfamily serine protease